MKISKDWDKICCTLDDFVNLQESPAGFWDTEFLAKLDLFVNKYEEIMEKSCNWRVEFCTAEIYNSFKQIQDYIKSEKK